MKSLSETFMGRILGLLADAVMRRRSLFLWPQFLLFGLCVVYTIGHLQFDMSRDNLVGSGKSYHQQYQKFKKEFPAQDDLVVVVESENTEKNRQFVERLGEKLSVETNLFTDVFYKGDLKMMGRKALLFAPESDLAGLKDVLKDYLPFLQQFTRATNLDSMFEMVNYQIYHAKREQNAENDALLKALPMLTRIVDQANASLQRPGTPPSPGITALFGPADEADRDYITSPDGRIYLVTARARREDLNNDAVERMRDLVTWTEREVPGINVGITGEPVLEHDEMQQSQKDSTVASVMSLLICALIFIYGYQETGRPIKATICLIIGLGYTLAFTTLAVGHLNILTITFLPILIGLAIDFGIHLITRYEEELRNGRSEYDAMRKAMVYTGQGIFTGAMTTAMAFLAMWLTNFKGIQEMGIICGGGMLVCFIPMMTMLPVMLIRGRQNALDQKEKENAERAVRSAEPEEIIAPWNPPKKKQKHGRSMGEWRTRIENIWLSRPRTVTLITLTVTALAATQFHKVYFDYNLLNMQSAGLPAVVFEKKLINSTPQSVLFAAVVADSPEQALELEEKLSKLPTVGTNYSMGPILTGDVTKKLKLIREIKKEIAPVQFQPPDRRPVDILELDRTLYSTAGYMGAAADAVLHETETTPPTTQVSHTNQAANTNELSNKQLAQQLLDLRGSINALRKRMLNMDEAVASEKLGAFQLALFDDVTETFQSIHDQDASSRLTAKDLPVALRDRFIGVTGKYMIQVYPRNKVDGKPFDIWQHDDQKRFITEIRSVYQNVTGTPVQLLEYTTLLKDSYVQAAYYALIAIAVMVLIHFRRPVFVILALLPVAIGTCWMFGLMGWLDIPLNPANIMTLPLVIGIGVTNGIHILNRYAEEGTASILSKSTGKAVFVSGLTAIAGFGSLILAQHQGIRSLGEVMSLGIALCMVAALAFVPAVLNLGGRRLQAPTKRPSGDNAQSTLGREEPR